MKISNIKENQDEDKEFFQLVKIGFANKRKQLQNNLVNGFGFSHELAIKRLQEAGFKPTVRAQELSVEDWQRLGKLVKKVSY